MALRFTLPFLIVALMGCGPSAERLPGEGVIVAFERREHWLSAFGGKGVPFNQMVDMKQFGDFMPGQPPALTGITVGRPNSERSDRAAKYFVYRRPQGVFEVGQEGYAARDGVGVSYPLYYYPADRRPERFLSAPILHRLKPNAEKETVQVFECGVAQPGIVVVLERGQVQQVIWTDITELSDRPQQHQCTPWG